ncbi:MAG: hypothetical protein MMC33_003014 [Icmadophila ericetorum]|nr:hypothetical protein [Icmadophila ericetorum]
MADNQPPKSPVLLPPGKSVELEDPGAHELDSSNEDEDVFTDAQGDPQTSSRPHSPIPTTRVEKVDDEPTYGSVPGTDAYKKRTQDAVPDEVAVMSRRSSIASRSGDQPPLSSGDTEIPRTVVEKVDPDDESYGDVPGTVAHAKRRADAVPDLILRSPPPGKASATFLPPEEAPSTVPVPRTVVTRVDSEPRHGEVPHTLAYEKRAADAQPDVVEKKADVPEEGVSPIAADGGFGPMEYDDDEEEEEQIDTTCRTNTRDDGEMEEKVEDSGFGDDFDDFEEGAAAEDFGDFDDGFREPEEESEEESEEELLSPQKPLAPAHSAFPLLDFSNLQSLDAIIEATNPHLSALFPAASDLDISTEKPNTDHTLLTSRSLSLWTQLIAPPPLQPPNWVRSRIRRLFLVSLGVPVDLDEILPASKQKKLILPYTTKSDPDLASKTSNPLTRLKEGEGTAASANTSTTSLDSQRSASASRRSTSKSRPAGNSNRKRPGPPPPPFLDTPSLNILCSTTPEKLSSMSDAEMRAHVAKLEDLTAKAGQVLEYWLQRKDLVRAEKEAFEGVIENLIRHAKRVTGRR